MERLSIGTMAKLNGTTPRALRFYASKGLLEPCYVDPDSGFRYFDIRQCYDLDRIQELQSLGCTLDEISEVLKSSDEDAYTNLLVAKSWEYEEQRRVLEDRIALVDGLLKKRRVLDDRPCFNEPSIEVMPQRTVIQVDASDLDPARADQGAEHVSQRWEHISRTIKVDLLHKGYPVAALLNAGCGIRQDNLVSRNYVFDQFFLFEDEISLGRGVRRTILPASEYAVLYSNGNTAPDGTYKTPLNLDKLLDFIEQSGYEVSGDYFDEILGESAARDGGRSVMFKMCIPIKRLGQGQGSSVD